MSHLIRIWGDDKQLMGPQGRKEAAGEGLNSTSQATAPFAPTGSQSMRLRWLWVQSACATSMDTAKAVRVLLEPFKNTGNHLSDNR
jgi:hypothetical protein